MGRLGTLLLVAAGSITLGIIESALFGHCDPGDCQGTVLWYVPLLGLAGGLLLRPRHSGLLLVCLTIGASAVVPFFVVVGVYLASWGDPELALFLLGAGVVSVLGTPLCAAAAGLGFGIRRSFSSREVQESA